MRDTPHAGVTNQFKIRVEDKTHVGADGTRLTAIRDLSLDLKPESMTVLMGPSGCGKTTLLRIVAGLDEQFSGEIDMPESVRLGFMFQEPRLLPWRTVRQNIDLVCAPGFDEDDLLRLAEAVGVEDMLARYPQELSLGLARRAALARAFSTEPGLLLLDEPFVSLDEKTADRLRRLLLEVWSARPTTAVMVTHNAREALLLADQLVLMAPRPTHVLAVETIDIPQSERDPATIEALHADLLTRFPANFSGV